MTKPTCETTQPRAPSDWNDGRHQSGTVRGKRLEYPRLGRKPHRLPTMQIRTRRTRRAICTQTRPSYLAGPSATPSFASARSGAWLWLRAHSVMWVRATLIQGVWRSSLCTNSLIAALGTPTGNGQIGQSSFPVRTEAGHASQAATVTSFRYRGFVAAGLHRHTSAGLPKSDRLTSKFLTAVAKYCVGDER